MQRCEFVVHEDGAILADGQRHVSADPAQHVRIVAEIDRGDFRRIKIRRGRRNRRC